MTTGCQASTWRQLGQACLLVLVAGCSDGRPSYHQGFEGVCVDLDGDGYGFECPGGSDCNDGDRNVHVDCARCSPPEHGCPCNPDTPPQSCSLPLTLTAQKGLLCREGTRYCRDGAFGAYEGIASFEVEPARGAVFQGLVSRDAAPVVCGPCQPDCYRIDDPLGAVAPDSAVIVGPTGGITLKSSATDAGVTPVLLDDPKCTPGVAPDVDCDGIPDAFDVFPSAPPFATDHNTIFMGLTPGQTKEQAFKIKFALNTADIYFLLDMTGSMEGERDNLLSSLTSGNFLPGLGVGIECADTDFDGLPNLTLTSGGIAANIACLIRDVRLGAGWFRDIPFVGPYANGDKVAPNDLEMFEHRQDMTSDIVAVLTALTGFQTRGNHNPPEGSMQALYALVTGSELYAGWDRPGVPKREGCPPDTWGYACFRNGAVPIVLHITDAPLQNGPSPTSVARAGYLDDCDADEQVCVCTKKACLLGFICLGCAEETCSCDNAKRAPLNYDTSVLSDMHAGSDATYHKLTTSAEDIASAQPVGAIDNVFVTYTGSTDKMASNLNYASTGNCATGSAWDSSSQTAGDAVFKFSVASSKTLTISTRGSHFDTSLMIKRVGAATAVNCNDNIAGDPDSEVSQVFPAGDYLAILKGNKAGRNGWFQITFGDKSRATTTPFKPQRWLGPTGDGSNGIRAALLARGVRVITVNSSLDPYLLEQAKVLSSSTKALDLLGSPLSLQIGADGIGLGLAVLDAIGLLANNLAMNVGVVLKESPDNPTPDFGFTVQAIDRPADGCSPPIDTDNDPAHLPDTHVKCLPGAQPQFKISFTNRVAPNSVPTNPADAKGGWNMKLQLIGDGTYVVDQIPVYIIPAAVAATPGTPLYTVDGSYEQLVAASGCTGTTAPVWRSLSWTSTLPAGTSLRWELCSGDSEAALAECTFQPVGTIVPGAACTSSATCPNGYCDASGFCHFVKGPACLANADCGASGACVASVCTWNRPQIDLTPVFGVTNPQGRRQTRVRATLRANGDRTLAPTLHDWRLNYDCTPML